MDHSEAISLTNNLKNELSQIDKLRQSTSSTGLSILRKLVCKEIQRLDDSILAFFFSKEPLMMPCDIIIPLLEGESMLNILAEFDLSLAEATEKFKQALNSELEELSNSNVKFPATSKFIQKVIDYTEENLKKQCQDECQVSGPEEIQIAVMDYNAAREKKERLRAEQNIIRNRTKAKAVDIHYLLQLTEAEIDRLGDDISCAMLSSASSSDGIKIPVECASMLSRIPTEYDLSSAAEMYKFTQKLETELKWVTSLPEQFPITFQFIQRVVSYVERCKREKCPSEGATDNQTIDRKVVIDSDNQTNGISASMEYSESTKQRCMLQKELSEIRKLKAISINGKSISPVLLEKEIDRLLADDIISKRNPKGLVVGDSMLSKVPADFGLSSAEATEKFKLTLQSELEELMKADAKFPITSMFIKKVIDHTDEYLKKQFLDESTVFGPGDKYIEEINYDVARDRRNMFCLELRRIKSRAKETEVDVNLLLKLLYAEISRLSNEIGHAILSEKNNTGEDTCFEEGGSMLSLVPDMYGLSSTAETEKFIQTLSNELKWVRLGGIFPLTSKFIQRVIGHAKIYMKDKRPFEVAVFGSTTNNPQLVNS